MHSQVLVPIHGNTLQYAVIIYYYYMSVDYFQLVHEIHHNSTHSYVMHKQQNWYLYSILY